MNTGYRPGHSTDITSRVQIIDRVGVLVALQGSFQEVHIRDFGNTDFAITLTFGISVSRSISPCWATYHVLVGYCSDLSTFS